MNVFYSFLIAAFLMNHPLHVSYTSIDFNTENKVVTASFKFFTQDFDLLFFHLYEKNIQSEMDHEFTPGQLDLIKKYLNSSFSIVTALDTIKFEYVRKEQDEESVWLYFTGPLPGDFSDKFVIINKLMLDLYEDQTNLVIVSQGIQEWGFTFNYIHRRYELAVGFDKT